MELKNSHDRFGIISKAFHWIIFLAVTYQFYLIWIYESLSQLNLERGNYMFLHKSVGATILLLTLVWITWRHFNVLPKSFPKERSWQHHLARFTHLAMLTAIVILPISGLLMSMAKGRGLDYFGIFTIAPFIPHSESLGGGLKIVHEIVAFILIGLVILHVAGALVHHFIYKDNVLRRMLPFVRLK